VSDEEKPQVTREGLFGELFGMAKEKAGELLGNDHLMAEGQLQQAIAEAHAEALAAVGEQAHPSEEHTGGEEHAAGEGHTPDEGHTSGEERAVDDAHPDESVS
jgi:uncharacterized protein YjbJ (UPF0337 family)